jgi:hypothetical protein
MAMNPNGPYRILRNDMPTHELQVQAYQMQGINPADVWVLVCAFDDETEAAQALSGARAVALPHQTFKLEVAE